MEIFGHTNEVHPLFKQRLVKLIPLALSIQDQGAAGQLVPQAIGEPVVANMDDVAMAMIFIEQVDWRKVLIE